MTLDELAGYAVLEHVPYGSKGASFVALVRMFQASKRPEAFASAQRQRDLKPGRLVAVAEVRLAEDWK